MDRVSVFLAPRSATSKKSSSLEKVACIQSVRERGAEDKSWPYLILFILGTWRQSVMAEVEKKVSIGKIVSYVCFHCCGCCHWIVNNCITRGFNCSLTLHSPRSNFYFQSGGIESWFLYTSPSAWYRCE